MDDNPVLEIRTYKVRAGAGAEYDALFRDGVVPMLQRHGVTVVRFGASLVDPDQYVLMRRFESVDRRAEQLSGFYGSDEWRDTFGAPVDRLLESYHTVVLPA